MKASRTGLVVSALPSLVMLGLFYSLAFHMHQSLGRWPMSIGERGFSSALVVHATITQNFFVVLLLLNLFVLPVAMVVCLRVERWKRFVRYLAWYGLLFVVGWAAMQLAPPQFLNWWWD